MNARAHLGRRGEDVAAEALRGQGYDIVERNFRCPEGEIDIVARRGDVIVFCEVKTRVTDRWGEPSEAVGFAKQRRLRGLAARWLKERGARFSEVRFDVVSVIVRGSHVETTHIPDAF